MTSPFTTCPQCRSPMPKGVVVGRSPGVKFKDQRSIAGDIGGRTLTTGIFNHSVDAYQCGTCGAVVIPGRRIEADE